MSDGHRAFSDPRAESKHLRTRLAELGEAEPDSPLAEWASFGAGAACCEAMEAAGCVPYRLRFDRDLGTGTYEFVGAGIEKLTGVPTHELTHERFGELTQEVIVVEPEVLSEPLDLAHAFRRGEIAHHRSDIRIQTPRGETVWLADSCTPLRDPETGEVIGSVGVLQDVTAWRLSSQMLRASEQRCRALFEQAADSMLLVDAETRAIVEFNTRAHENLGYTREEFRDLQIADFEAMESPEEVRAHIARIHELGSDIFETKHRTKAGEIRDVQVNSRCIRSPEGTLFLSICRDITDQRRNERLAAVGRTASGLAHSIKNIQANLMASSGLVDRSLREGNWKKTAEAWPHVQRSNRRINHLIKDMLSMARENEVLRTTFVLRELIADVVADCHERAEEDSVELRISLEECPVRVTLDYDRLYDCLLNVIHNGIEAIEWERRRGGVVEVSAHAAPEAERLLVTVRDNGPGMATDIHARAFEPFFSTKGGRGTGLGLTVVKKTVAEMGGKVSIDTALGGGAAVTFDLPCG